MQPSKTYRNLNLFYLRIYDDFYYRSENIIQITKFNFVQTVHVATATHLS